MDFFKRLIYFFSLLFISSLTQANSYPQQNQGIAFIHGTQDHRKDAYGNYWKTDFIRSISQALANPDNYYVVHCNFDQYMWHEESSDCVADQLLQFINDKQINSITVYTHSDGANVMRWILSNPTYDSRYLTLKNTIKQVIAIAPSSGGTPLADEVINGGIFEGSLGWILGYLSNAVRQQRIGDMLIFNNELLLGTKGRPSLPIPFKVVVGSDVRASPLSSGSYCNGYLLNSSLKITKLYLDKCADGFLNCSSQLLAGDLWFYDVNKTQDRSPLSHNQSRHSCFGMDNILISALATEGVVQ